jgi:hypothetical protein
MFASPRLAVAILLLGLGMVLAFAAGFSYGDAVFEVDAPLIRAGDGLSISLLTGSYVPR